MEKQNKEKPTKTLESSLSSLSSSGSSDRYEKLMDSPTSVITGIFSGQHTSKGTKFTTYSVDISSTPIDCETQNAALSPTSLMTCISCRQDTEQEESDESVATINSAHFELSNLSNGGLIENAANDKAPKKEEVVYQCEMCGFLTYELSEAEEHLTQQHIIVAKQTPPENNRGEVQSDLRTKYSRVTITKTPLQCEFCNFVCLDRVFLLSHMGTHRAQRRLECRDCDVFFKTSKELKKHFDKECVFWDQKKSAHPVLVKTVFMCNDCNRTFTSRGKLFEHRIAKAHLYSTIDLKDDEYVLICVLCDTNSTTADEAIAHHKRCHKKRTHVFEKRHFLCDRCGKTFKQSCHLSEHMRVHNGIAKFACDIEGCKRMFVLRRDLREHTRTAHTKERPYKCKLCKKEFMTGSSLVQHRVIHTPRRFTCDICKKQFYRGHALKTHLLIHTGERPHHCSECDKSFRRRYDLQRHVIRCHKKNNEVPEEHLE